MILRTLLTFIFIFLCNAAPLREKIEVGKTIKIESTNFKHLSKDMYSYLWSSPIKSDDTLSKYIIEENKMLLTPNLPRDYNVTLLIESVDKKSTYEENFLFTAYKATKENEVLNPEKDGTESIKLTNGNKVNNNNNKTYTIQVAAWPTIEKAREEQYQLRIAGYDSFIEQIYIESKKATWWRVRVGHFTDKNSAEGTKKELEEYKGSKLWIDFITE